MNRFWEWKGHRFLGLIARTYIALVFLFACVHKIIAPSDFAVDIATYQILPTVLVNPTAIVLPFVEAAAGLLLLVGFRTKGAALLIFGMMLMFTIALGVALAKGLDMSCGCFASKGAIEDPISWKTVFRDVSWMLLSVYVLLFDNGSLGVDGWVNSQRRKSVSSSAQQGGAS